MSHESRILAVKIALTIVTLEFFGPIVRDFHPSHALNPDWVGHARVHLVWLLGFMGLYLLLGVLFLFLVGREVGHGPEGQPVTPLPDERSRAAAPGSQAQEEGR